MTGPVTEIAMLREYIAENRDALLRYADDPAEFNRVLESLATFWVQETDPAVQWSETWNALAKYPRVVGEIVRQNLGHAAETVSPPAIRETTSEPVEKPKEARSLLGRDQIAGGLAVLIVLTSLVILLFSLFRTGNTERAVAKDVLVFANGIMGVVLGYYFGRAPGEARAERAEDNAHQARSELDRTLGEVRGIVESSAMSSRGAATTVTLASHDVERLRTIAARRG